MQIRVIKEQRLDQYCEIIECGDFKVEKWPANLSEIKHDFGQTVSRF